MRRDAPVSKIAARQITRISASKIATEAPVEDAASSRTVIEYLFGLRNGGRVRSDALRLLKSYVYAGKTNSVRVSARVNNSGAISAYVAHIAPRRD